MEFDHESYAGLELSSGRRPVTLALLDIELNVHGFQQCSVSDAISILDDQNNVRLAINAPGSKIGQAVYADLKKKLKSAGFSSFSKNEGTRIWIDANAEESYRAIRNRIFPRRTLEGRIQRALILYEEGVRIHDPMDFFEEITRHKILQGNLPNENMYSVRQLDALVVAYIAWLAVHRPQKVESHGDVILPRITANE